MSLSFSDPAYIADRSTVIGAWDPINPGEIWAIGEGRQLTIWNGATWSAEEALQGVNADTTAANLAFDDQGNCLMVYAGSSIGGDMILEYRPAGWSSGAEYTETVETNANPDNYEKGSRIAVRWQPDDGDFVIAWARHSGGVDGNLVYKLFTPSTKTLSARTDLPQSEVSASAINKHMDCAYSLSDSTRHFVCDFKISGGGRSERIYYTADEGTTWEEVDGPTALEAAFEEPQIFVDPLDATVHIFAQEEVAGTVGDRKLWHYQLLSSTNWLKTLMSSGNASDADGVWNHGATMDMYGNLYVAWSQWNATDSKMRTHVRVKERGKAWSAATEIAGAYDATANDDITAERPGSQWTISAPARGGMGTLGVLWTEYDGAGFESYWAYSVNSIYPFRANESLFVFDGNIGGSWWKWQGTDV